MRFLLLILPLALAACSSPGADLTPEATFALANSAAARGETKEALALYKDAAKRGDLDALSTVSRAMRQGYIRAPEPENTRQGEIMAHHLPIFVLPGQAGLWRDRYETEKAGKAAAGDPYARYLVAQDLRIWKRDATPAERDSARAIMDGLVAEHFGPAVIPATMRLYREGDVQTADSMLALVKPPYHASACAFGVTWRGMTPAGQTPDISAEATARVIDAYEACPDLPDGYEKRSQTIVQNLMRSERERDIAHLDSVRALGVFQRHPHLAQI